MTAARDPAERLLALVGSSWRTQAVHAMVVLGVPDALAAGPLDAGELARRVEADRVALQRLLRGLVLLDLMAERHGGYELTPMGRLLCTRGATNSLAHWVSWWAGRLWPAWGMLPEAVRTGCPVRQRVDGHGGYGLQQADSHAARTFHLAMAALSASVGPQVLAALPRECGHVVDVGGGSGELIGQLLNARPRLRATLLEQPHAIDGARRHLGATGADARCAFVAGDFFRAVPAGGDAYLLKSVLHNWNDAAAIRLLRRCREAMAADAALLVIERLFDPSHPSEAHVRTDLNMLVSLGGRERTSDEVLALAARAGLVLVRRRPGPSHTVLTFRRARSDRRRSP